MEAVAAPIAVVMSSGRRRIGSLSLWGPAVVPFSARGTGGRDEGTKTCPALDQMDEGASIPVAVTARHRPRLLAFISAVLGLSFVGCGGNPFAPKACTLIGCGDQFTATVSAASGALPTGTHTVDVTADGAMLSCTFVFPLETLPSGGTIGVQCQNGLRVDVVSATICTTTQSDAALMQRCDPVPGQLKEHITVSGTPASIRVEQSVGGTVILDESAMPTYQSSQPNGPGCEPICRQAGAEWTIP